MKRIILFVLLFAALKVAGQTTGYLRYDTVKIMKQGGTCELYIINKTKDSLGLLTNVGGGLTRFIKPKMLDDSTMIIGVDTVVIRGASGGTTLSNVGSGFRWVKSASGQIKTVENTNTITWDSTANTLKANADTSYLVTQTKLNDTAAALRAAVGGGGSSLYSDLGPLSETKIYSPAVGTASSSNVTNYSHTSVDSARYKFSTTRAGTGGSEYGGWLAASTSGDSIKVTSPFGVVIGDSQAEGHPAKHGRLHWLLSGVAQNTFKYDYPDSVGQLSYHLRWLTNMRWYNHGIGGETTVAVRRRFFRDVLGIDVGSDINGRGTRTLSRKPQVVIIIAGINDIFTGVSAQTTMDNLEWMASVCQQEGIRCVILNIPGDAISTQANLQAIASMNKWLASGVMDQYGACVVDYNSWWNDPAYGNDNIHSTGLIVDDIHPSAVGYDSLANYIYRKAKLPRMTKAVFINELDPAGFTGYSRPAGITINSDAYTISSANDTIAIASYVPDSVWIKVTSSTNVTGTTNSGFSHIEWYTTNNPLDTPYYTKRTLYSGSQKSSVNIGKLAMIAPTPESGYAAIDVTLNDMTNKALQLKTSGAGGQLIVNGLSNTSPINSSVLSIYGTNGLGMNGNINATGTSHVIGHLQLQINGGATTWGYGISTENTASAMRFQTTPATNKDAFRFDSWSGANVAIGSTKTNLIALTNIGFGNASSVDQTANAVYINPTYNQTTSSFSNVAINGITYNPILTSLGNARHRGLFILSGNNYLNSVADSTCIGCDSNAVIGAKFRVNGSVRLDLGSDATGDIYYRNSGGLFTRLGVGSNGDVLTLASGLPSWAAPSGGVSGTGTSGRIAYWSGSSTLTNNANFLFNGSVFSTGTTNTQGQLNVGGSKDLSSSGAQSYYAPATYTDQATSASGTASSYDINLIASPTIAAGNSSVTFPLISTLAIVAPTAGTNATLTKRYALRLEPSSGNNANLGVSGFIDGVTHLRSGGSGASIAAGAGSGTGASGSVSGGDMAGKIDITTGSGPSTSATVVTITFNASYAAAPTVILTPGNAAAAALTGGNQVFVSSTSTTNFVVTSGSSALGASTQYIWYYHVIQ